MVWILSAVALKLIPHQLWALFETAAFCSPVNLNSFKKFVG